MSFKYYDHENILIEDLKAIYFVMPKVACTSLKSIFAKHLGLNNFDNSDHFKNVHQMVDFPYANKQEIYDNYKDYFKFGFVRNPWDRVVSAYTNKITNDPNYNNPSFTNGVGVYSYDEKGKNRFHVGMSFEEYLEVIRTTEPIDYDGHFRIQHWILTDMQHRMLSDFVGKLETLDRDFKYVCERIGLENVELPKFNESKKNKVRFQDYYNDKTKKIVEKLYQQDIDIYRFKFDEKAEIFAIQPLPKNDEPKLSVIIPTYNDKGNIDRAISSVLNQDEKAVQIIVVDDFSTDGTFENLNETWKDKNIEIYRLNKHESLGGARNFGLKKAKGDYILFLDSDDWYEPNSFSKILNFAKKQNADVVSFGMYRIKSNYERVNYHIEDVVTEGGSNALSLYSHHKIGSTVCNKLFDRNLLISNNIRFISPYYHEDVLFTAKVLSKCKKYVSINKYFYNYYQNPKSIVNIKPSPLHLQSYLKIANDLVLFIKQNLSKNEEDKKIAQLLISSHFFNDIVPRIKIYKEAYPNTYISDVRNFIKKELSEYQEFLNYTIEYISDTHLIVNTKNDHIKLQEGKIADLENKLNVLENSLSESSRNIETLNDKIQNYEKEIAQLRKKEERLKEIEESFSWRVVKKMYKTKDKYFPFVNKLKNSLKK